MIRAIVLIAFLNSQASDRVKLFQAIGDAVPSPEYLRRGLGAVAGSTMDDRLAKAYFQGMLGQSGTQFTKQLKSGRYSQFTERTLESVPYALEHFANRGDTAPIEAVIRWPWDGAPSEIFSSVFADILKTHPPLVVRMMARLTPRSGDLVCEQIGSLLSKQEAKEQIQTARVHKQSSLVHLWTRIEKYAFDPP